MIDNLPQLTPRAYKCKVGLAMDSNKAYKALKDLILQALAEVDARYGGKAELAARMGVAESTIGRWAKQARGAQLSLENALRLAEGLMIPMEVVLRAMYPDEAEDAITLFSHDKQILRDLVIILSTDPEGWQAIKTQIRFVASRASKK